MGAGVQVFSYMLNLVATGIGFYCCLSPHWSVNDSENDVIQAIVRNNGLWVKCTTLATGTWQCDEYKEFFLQLPVHIQLARGLMASSLALGGISLLLAIPGLHCTRIYENDDFGSSLKSKILFICGVMIMIQALATCCAISYYAHVIIADYYDRHIMPNTSDHLIYGHSLYLGWVSMGINFLSGLLLISLESGKMKSRSKRPSLPPYGTQLGTNPAFVADSYAGGLNQPHLITKTLPGNNYI